MILIIVIINITYPGRIANQFLLKLTKIVVYIFKASAVEPVQKINCLEQVSVI